jgi:hypothetical protein
VRLLFFNPQHRYAQRCGVLFRLPGSLILLFLNFAVRFKLVEFYGQISHGFSVAYWSIISQSITMPSSALQSPQKCGRHTKYASKGEKVKEYINRKRAQRRVQAAAQRDIQSNQFHVAQQAPALVHPHSPTGLSVLA